MGRIVGRVYVIWEYEQRRGYDREEPLDPFYTSEDSANQQMSALDAARPVRDGYREVRRHELRE